MKLSPRFAMDSLTTKKVVHRLKFTGSPEATVAGPADGSQAPVSRPA